MGWKFPEIPRPHPVVHLHYLEHFGASDHSEHLLLGFEYCRKIVMDQFSRDEPSKYLELLSFAMKTQKNLVLKFLHIYIVHKMLFITIFERHTRQKKKHKIRIWDERLRNSSNEIVACIRIHE